MIPNDCKYTRTHEWVRIEGTTATVGITDHAQDSLGDITYVELPRVGSTVTKGKECGVIESVKAASDLYAPISGTVSEVNETLSTTPEIINKDPHGAGWFYKVTGVNPDEANDLMDAAAYSAFLESHE